MSQIITAKPVEHFSQIANSIYEAAREIKYDSKPDASLDYLPEIILRAPFWSMLSPTDKEEKKERVITYWLPNTPWQHTKEDFQPIANYSFLEAWCRNVWRVNSSFADYSFRALTRKTSVAPWREILQNKNIIPQYMVEGFMERTNPIPIFPYNHRISIYKNSAPATNVERTPEFNGGNGRIIVPRPDKLIYVPKTRVSHEKRIITKEDEERIMAKLRSEGKIL